MEVVRSLRLPCAAVALWALACDEAPPPAPDPVAVADASVGAEPETPAGVVIEVVGTVEIRRRERTDWAILAVGDRVEAEDSVRTAAASAMELKVDDVKLKVRERSEVRVKRVSRGALSARAKGHVESTVLEGKGEVELEAEGSDAVVRTRGGHFLMTADGQGVVAVATVSGQVDLSAAGKSVSLGAGQQSHVTPNAKPAAPSSALKAVLLHVRWPERETKRAVVPVAGKVDVGSRVVVHGRPVTPDAKGNFQVKVPLKRGKQRIAVVVTDRWGRSAREDVEILMDNKNDVKVENRLWADPRP